MPVMFKRVRVTDGSIPEYEWRESSYIAAWENLSYDWMTLDEYLQACYQYEFCNAYHFTDPCQYIDMLTEAIREGIVTMKMDFGEEFAEQYQKLEEMGNEESE